jgi:uncharacterized membrane protein
MFAPPEGHLVSYLGIVERGHLLDVPNAAMGCLYYAYRLVDSFFPILLTQLAATCALSASLFLAYQLAVMKKLCLLCWTMHILNLFLWSHAVFALKLANAKSTNRARNNNTKDD